MKRWLQRWLGFVDLHNYVARELCAFNRRLGVPQEDTRNWRMRLAAAEASCRLLEGRCKLLEATVLSDGLVLGAIAMQQAEARNEKDLDRLDRSAAEARGMTLLAYRADKQRRQEEKAARAKAEIEADTELVDIKKLNEDLIEETDTI
jgi:hypothetical protein